MELLIAEALESDLIDWLQKRYSVYVVPEFAVNADALLRALPDVRAMIVPASVSVDAGTLRHAPRLRAVGRITPGLDNIDLEACARAGIEVVRSTTGSAQADAEFAVGAILSMLRRVPVVGPDGTLAGRELARRTVGLVGLTPGARTTARVLASFGAKVVGYDPSVHASDTVWGRWNVRPLALRELFEQSDAVSVQLGFFSRYRGMLGGRLLPYCKPDQVLVSLSHSGLLDIDALAEALRSGRMAAAWLDSLEPGELRRGRPLAGLGNLRVTPRVASITAESRRRCARAVVMRIDALLNETPDARGAQPIDTFTQAPSADSADRSGAPRWR